MPSSAASDLADLRGGGACRSASSATNRAARTRRSPARCPCWLATIARMPAARGLELGGSIASARSARPRSRSPPSGAATAATHTRRARLVLHRGLEVGRVQVAAGDDDHLVAAADHEQLAVVDQRRCRRSRSSRRRSGAARRRCSATACEPLRNSIVPDRRRRGASTRTSTPSSGEPGGHERAGRQVRARRPSPGCGIARHGSCGRTIVTASVASAMPYAGQNASGSKPDRRERVGEPLERVGVHGLRPDDDRAQARQVERSAAAAGADRRAPTRSSARR